MGPSGRQRKRSFDERFILLCRRYRKPIAMFWIPSKRIVDYRRLLAAAAGIHLDGSLPTVLPINRCTHAVKVARPASCHLLQHRHSKAAHKREANRVEGVGGANASHPMPRRHCAVARALHLDRGA